MTTNTIKNLETALYALNRAKGEHEDDAAEVAHIVAIRDQVWDLLESLQAAVTPDIGLHGPHTPECDKGITTTRCCASGTYNAIRPN